MSTPGSELAEDEYVSQSLVSSTGLNEHNALKIYWPSDMKWGLMNTFGLPNLTASYGNLWGYNLSIISLYLLGFIFNILSNSFFMFLSKSFALLFYSHWLDLFDVGLIDFILSKVLTDNRDLPCCYESSSFLSCS